MSSDSRKKEKKRLKRKQKQQQLRKVRSRTPLSRIAAEGGRLECWVTRDWREMGMADILVLGHAPGGRCAFAAFLVDLWCVGLKDTWGEAELSELEFHEQILDRWLERTNGVKLDPATAKRLVLGGVRFSRQTGFKLPPHWDRWVSIFSPMTHIAAADISDFGKDGGLVYVGTAKFLRERLIASTPEEFLRRPDVKWMTFDGDERDIEELYQPENAGGFYDDEDEDDDYDESDEEYEDEFDEEDPGEREEIILEMLEQLSTRLADATRKWCFVNGKPPSPRLVEGATLTFATTQPGKIPTDDTPGTVAEFDHESSVEIGERILSQYKQSERDEIIGAARQIQEFIRQFKNPLEMLAAVGLDKSDEDDQGEDE